MKKLIIFFLLVFSISVFSQDSTGLLKYNKRELAELLKYGNYNLAYGITIPETQKFNDFSKRVTPVSTYQMNKFKVDSDNNLIELSPGNNFYKVDFAEDPFDGMIEILVVGEPSTSTNLTLLIAGLLGLVMIKYRKSCSIKI